MTKIDFKYSELDRYNENTLKSIILQLRDEINEKEDVLSSLDAQLRAYNSSTIKDFNRDEEIFKKLRNLDNPNDLADYIRFICGKTKFRLMSMALDDKEFRD